MTFQCFFRPQESQLCVGYGINIFQNAGWDVPGVVDTDENVEVIDFQQDWGDFGPPAPVRFFFPEMIWKEEAP